MERWPTRTRTTLAGSLLALTLIAPWAIAQDPDPVPEHLHKLALTGTLPLGPPEAFGQDGGSGPLANGCGPLSIIVDVRGDVVESNAVRDVVERRLRSARLYDSDAESALLVDVYAFPTTARVTATFRRRDGQPLPLGWPAEFRGNPLTDESVLRVVGRTVDEFLLDYLGATEETCEPADPGDEVGSVDPVFPVREPERVASESSSLDFTRGSHRDDVLRIQGTPSSINQYSDHETWWYGVSTIDISLRDQRVTEWDNLGGNLKVRLDPGPNVTDAQAFTRGSHRDDVLRIQGTPSSINQYSDHETWWYGVSTIDISLRDQRVTEWDNLGGNLKVRLDPGPNVTDAQAFTRGSHRDDVLRIQGTPSSVNQYSDHETWWYGVSTIDISLRDQRVTEWDNLGGNLKVRLDPGPNVTDAQAFTRGSHREGVFQTGEITDLPMILFKVDPQYSEEARKARYQGTVVLEAIIRSDGTIEILRVVRSLDFGLDENAIQALKQWKFRPGMRNGQPVDVVLNIEVNFNLR